MLLSVHSIGIERHENLRTVFIQVENEPRQKILSAAELGFQIQEVDLRKIVNTEEFINKWLEKDAREPFDLENGPLLRATLFQTGYEKFILAFNIHHIIRMARPKRFIKNFSVL